MDQMVPLSAALTLLLVMDPLGNAVVFSGMLREFKAERQQRIIFRESVIGLFTLIGFLFVGPWFLQTLQIDQQSIRISGGVVLFLIALQMVFPPPQGMMFDERCDGEPFIVPLAIPLIAGPSAIATVVLMGTRGPDHAIWLLALLAAWGLSTLTLLLSGRLTRILGQRGLAACERLMGMALTVIAIQMILSGLREFFC